MAKRRRYDTVELVAEIKKERRNGMILALTGVGILVVLLGLYVTSVGDDEVPTRPTADIGLAGEIPSPGKPTAAETPTPTVGSATDGADEAGTPDAAGDGTEDPAADAGEGGDAAEDPKPEPAVDAPAKFKVVLTKKGVLFVDGKKIGKGKKHKLELSAEEHEIKAKFGKKTVTQKVIPKAGQSYELRFDARKKKAKLTKK